VVVGAAVGAAVGMSSVSGGGANLRGAAVALDQSVPTAVPSAVPSMAPSAAPSEFSLERFQNVFLPDFALAAIANQTTPQADALAWLSEDPFLDTRSSFEILQRYSLAVMYYATDGENWFSNDGWVDDYRFEECEWFMTERSIFSCFKGRYEEIKLVVWNVARRFGNPDGFEGC
jgi:hypothetical protein